MKTVQTNLFPLKFGDTGTINAILSNSVGVYITTDKSLWFSNDLYYTVNEDTRIDSIGTINVSLRDKSNYYIDNDDIFFYLYEHKYIYSINKANIVNIMSPTKYPDTFLFTKNENNLIYEGYVNQRDTEYLDTNENIVFSYIDENKYIGISKSGKIIVCDIATGTWEEIRDSIISGNICTACYIDPSSDMLYIGTFNGLIYRGPKSSVYDSPSGIELLYASESGSIYGLCVNNNVVYTTGYLGRVNAYDLTTRTYHPYNEIESSYAVNPGTALGNVNSRIIMIVGQDLVIAGNSGRIASCNLVTKRWTRYNGINDIDESDNIDSQLFSDGTILGHSDITQVINYLNKTLIIFGNEGRMASCNLKTFGWTDYTGSSLNPLSPGPPIYNNGGHSTGRTIRATLVTEQGIIIGCDGGYLSSLNPETGGMTKYNGLDVSITIPGPGISFDGFDFNYNILSLALDIMHSTVVLSGQSACVATYSLIEKELLSPHISKMYYIGRRNTINDSLSSYLVQLSKETLQEKKTFYPPRDCDILYEDLYNSSYYMYRMGDIIYKLSSSLDELLQSVDNGETYVRYQIANQTWNASIHNISVKNIKGYVAKDGNFMLHCIINNEHYFLIVYKTNSLYAASWYRPDSSVDEECIADFGFFQGDKNADYLFYITIKDTLKNSFYPAIISINPAIPELVFLHDIFNQYNNFHTIHISMNNNGNIYTTNENHFMLYEWEYKLGLFPELKKAPTNIMNDAEGYITKIFRARKLTDYIDSADSIYAFLGFYALPNKIFNYIYGEKNGNILIMSLRINVDNEIILNSHTDDTDEAWGLTLYEINAQEYIDLYAQNQYLGYRYASMSPVAFNISYLSLFDGNTKGLLGLNISYWEANDGVASTRGSYKEEHLIISLDNEIYKNFIHPLYRVYKKLPGKLLLVMEDTSSREIIISSYNDNGVYGLNTNASFRLKLSDALLNSPLRSLSDAWYNTSVYMRNDINAVKIRAKISHIAEDSDISLIDKQLSFRYEVLIINETTGSYLLYETEKSTVHTRLNNDTKMPEPFLKIKAIDNFEDHIIELYGSRQAGRQTAFIRVDTTQDIVPDGYIPKTVLSEDFYTIFQLGKRNREDAPATGMYYTIKIRPITTLASSFDVQFYIEPYKNTSNFAVTHLLNNINRSEFKSVDHIDERGISEFSFGEPSGILAQTMSDVPNIINTFKTTNHSLYAAYSMDPVYLRKGFADTLACFITGRGAGRYDRMDGMIANVGYNTWSIIPYSVNKKHITYLFDSNGTKHIRENFDIEFLKNGRNISKMREFGVYTPSSINIADYYADYKDSGRIVKNEGLVLTSRGIYENISTLDGKQKRILPIHETNEGTVYRYTNHGLDAIRSRLYGYAYDFVDRYTTFEIPYYYIKSWWISARGYITRSNESLLTLDYDASRFDSIGRALFPFDFVNPPPSISKPNYEDEGGGLGSGGIVVNPEEVAFSILIKEKYPLTHWDGYNDLDFVRIYKDIYVDRHEVERIIIESPHEIVPRNLYYYHDTLDWERKGKETLKYMTGYYYTSHDWKIYYHEVREITSGYTTTDNTFISNNSTLGHLIEDYNASVVLSDVFTEKQWYINEKPLGSEAWPRTTTQVVGERITNMTNPLIDYVAHISSMPLYVNNGTNIGVLDTNKIYCRIYRRGELYYSLETMSRGHNMFDIINPIASIKQLSPVTYTHSDTYGLTGGTSGDPSNIINRIRDLNTFDNRYLTLIVIQDAMAINSDLMAALRTIGISSATILSPAGRYRHIVLGTTKSASGMIEYLDTVASTYYPKGYGYIAPIKNTLSWSYASIENINNNTPWVATVKKYLANCTEPTENRNMVLASGSKQYDQYVGIATHKYLYATKYSVSLLLNGINSKTQSKDFYYYTVEGEGQSYYSQYTHWWDKRAPSNTQTADIVEREYIGRIEPTDNDKRVGYNFREWLNNGTSQETVDYYDYYTKWFEITTSSVLSIPLADEKGELLDQYIISGTEKYQWHDGTILSVPRSSTFATLKSSFGCTITIEVSYDSTSGGVYNIRRKITFIGTKINAGSSNTFEKTWSTTATYTTSSNSPAGGAESTATGKRVTKWG